MGMGGSIFFLVLGAILAFAIKLEPDWIDLGITGWIFMIAGVVGIVLTGWFTKRKRRLHHEVHQSHQQDRMARRQAVRRADQAAATDGHRGQPDDAEGAV